MAKEDDIDYARITVHVVIPNNEKYEELEAEAEKLATLGFGYAHVIVDKICTEYVNAKQRKATRGNIMGVWDQADRKGDIEL